MKKNGEGNKTKQPTKKASYRDLDLIEFSISLLKCSSFIIPFSSSSLASSFSTGSSRFSSLSRLYNFKKKFSCYFDTIWLKEHPFNRFNRFSSDCANKVLLVRILFGQCCTGSNEPGTVVSWQRTFGTKNLPVRTAAAMRPLVRKIKINESGGRRERESDFDPSKYFSLVPKNAAGWIPRVCSSRCRCTSEKTAGL